MSVKNKYIIPTRKHAQSHTYLCVYTRMGTHINTEFKNGFPSTMSSSSSYMSWSWATC